MSEEKLYAVKNDEGKYYDCEYEKFLPLSDAYCPAIVSEDNAKAIVNDYGGQIVTFVEEPKKVVLSEKQAEIVEDAHVYMYPAKCITDSHYHAYPEHYIPDDTDNSDGLEELLMNAYVNGYTVKKEKKYRLPVPNSWCGDNDHYWRKESDGTLTWSILSGRAEDFEFTKDEIGKFELQDCEKEEVTDDE
ncbi:Hypothetical protein LOCK919_2121 [Lacticaseibacillus paracasei]|jgi:hypothetical protein|uniref:DUF1642 domain-containing protein n=1 Tax=Lacticaseibacillus paracasei TaxID=1597 RepID=UPI00035573CF|nr:DUF1642 domain-containing protein [Lacticaseibacillus paracasei]AGP68803.1 Hypothetical protein LOCK919_2121 [Lacticaseibacillus paracasei]